jgi:hypothetical protein
MKCTKLDCIGEVNFGIMSESLPFMGTTLVSSKKSWRTFPQIWVEELRNPHLGNRK